MTLPVSGLISLNQVNTELALLGTAQITLNNAAVRALFGVPSGQISLSNGYSKSFNTGVGFFILNGVINTSQKILFSTEVYSSSSAGLSSVRTESVGVNSAERGYSMLGKPDAFASNYFSEIDGIIFSSATSINPAATLSIARAYASGVNSSTRGYALGGGTAAILASDVPYTEIDGIIFSSETAVNPAAALAVARLMHGSGVSSSTIGLAGGGATTTYSGKDATTYRYNEIDGITFASESALNPAAALVVARNPYAAANSSTKGVFFSGSVKTGVDTSSYTTEVDAIIFATQTISNTAASFPLGPAFGTTMAMSGAVNSDVKAYIASSETNADSTVNYGYSIPFNFSNETFSAGTTNASLFSVVNSITGVQSQFL